MGLLKALLLACTLSSVTTGVAIPSLNPELNTSSVNATEELVGIVPPLLHPIDVDILPDGRLNFTYILNGFPSYLILESSLAGFAEPNFKYPGRAPEEWGPVYRPRLVNTTNTTPHEKFENTPSFTHTSSRTERRNAKRDTSSIPNIEQRSVRDPSAAHRDCTDRLGNKVLMYFGWDECAEFTDTPTELGTDHEYHIKNENMVGMEAFYENSGKIDAQLDEMMLKEGDKAAKAQGVEKQWEEAVKKHKEKQKEKQDDKFGKMWEEAVTQRKKNKSQEREPEPEQDKFGGWL